MHYTYFSEILPLKNKEKSIISMYLVARLWICVLRIQRKVRMSLSLMTHNFALVTENDLLIFRMLRLE